MFVLVAQIQNMLILQPEKKIGASVIQKLCKVNRKSKLTPFILPYNRRIVVKPHDRIKTQSGLMLQQWRRVD